MPISLKNMRGCASPASTTICNSTTVLRQTAVSGTPRLIQRRYNNNNQAPCISELPINPRSLYRKPRSDEYLTRRKSYELLRETTSFREDLTDKYTLALVPSEPLVVGPAEDRAIEKRRDLVHSTPVYRLNLDRSTPLVVPSQQLVKSMHTAEFNRQSGLDDSVIVQSSLPPAPSSHQVVVLRVSLHCRGCEGKLRKHLSKMQGVTSFSIDLEKKKVTVIGNMTPLDVLTNISKVKFAQFWPSPSASATASSTSSSSSSSLSTSEFN